jgi:hypothetical protein
MMKTTDPIGLVAGAGGIIGDAAVKELKQQSWTVRALARRAVEGVETITTDLVDALSTTMSLTQAADTTHLFYAALSPDPDLSVEAERNGRMLGNLLDGNWHVKSAKTRLAPIFDFQAAIVAAAHAALASPRNCRRVDLEIRCC